jgi:hypothetical protein
MDTYTLVFLYVHILLENDHQATYKLTKQPIKQSTLLIMYK